MHLPVHSPLRKDDHMAVKSFRGKDAEFLMPALREMEVQRMKASANKYGARKREYGGHVYHSTKEANYAAELDLRVKGSDIKCWERQVPIGIAVNGHHVCNVIVDFLLTHNDDSKEFVEVKGFATAIWKLKYQLLKATFLHDNPKFRYTVV